MRTAFGKPVAGAVLFLLLGGSLGGAAQQSPSPDSLPQDHAAQRAGHLAYDAEMAQEGHDCPDQLTLVDRNECLNSVRVQTYKNFDAFLVGLRDALIDQSPNDANALALDATERTWEKYRTEMCDAVSNVYDVGTIKHPGSTQPSARIRCLIQLTRERMRALMQLYDATF